MMVHPMASTAGSNPTSQNNQSNNASGPNNQGTPAGFQPQQITMSDFMTLLSAQLQGQDPTNPVDPTTFVTQLAQFTELDEVSQIYSLLQSYAQGAAANGSTGNQGAGSTPKGSQS